MEGSHHARLVKVKNVSADVSERQAKKDAPASHAAIKEQSHRVGGVLLGSVIPFTLIVILPTYKQLLSPTLDKRSAETERLLARWAMLHAVRIVLSGLALLLFLYLAIFAKPL